MLVRQQLDVAVRNVGMMNFPLQGSDSEDLVAELGEYFARTALLWAQLTEQLVHAPQVAESSQQAHERSRAVSHLSDLAEVARIDVNMEKLRFVHLPISSAQRAINSGEVPFVSGKRGEERENREE